MLLLDEPLGALDLKLRKQMQVELKQIQREVGITFVYVTHDQEEALAMSDRIAVMNDGVIEQCGAPEEVYEHPAEEFVAGFIGISNLIEGVGRGRRRVRIATGLLRAGAGCPEDCERGRHGPPLRAARRRSRSTRLEEGMVTLDGTVVSSASTSASAPRSPSRSATARSLVALEQATYRARADDRWEPGTEIKIGWHPEHCLVLR